MPDDTATPEQAARDQGINHLKKQRDFRGHVVVYLLVNTFLVVLWAITSHGFFWPAFVIAPWGIGVAANAWDVYGRKDISEEAIQHEVARRNARA